MNLHPELANFQPEQPLRTSSTQTFSFAFISCYIPSQPVLYRTASLVNMLTIGNLSIGLCRRCTVPTSLPLPHASPRRRHALRARIPLAPYRTSSTTRSNSKLVVSGELEGFASGISDFRSIRMPGLAYFDKTEYIPVLENVNTVQLLCRPRRFGKSLTVSMLRYFHGVQFRRRYDELFKVCGMLLVQDSPAHNH